MDKELIDRLRCMLDFMEEYDALVSEARRNGDIDREEHLLADEQDDDAPATGKEPPF